ncbi:MAG TPA: MFS transporter [Alphaproteobacteria bacterium]|nr:MFS transporter [Alphaproteobacteria bacterium]
MTATATASPDAKSLRAAYGLGVLGISLLDLYALIVPLYAVMLGASATEIGILMGSRSVLPAIFSIHGGSLMDRLGTRRVMLTCTSAVTVLALMFPSVPWFPALVVIQLLSGLFTTFNWIGAQTLIAQVADGDPGRLGTFNFVCRFGTIGAPLVAGYLWDVGGPWPTFGMIASWAAMMFVLIWVIPEPNSELAAETRPSIWTALPRLSDYTRSLALMLIPVVAFTVIVSGLRNAATSIQNSIYVVFLQGIGYDGMMIGVLFAALEVTTGIASLNVKSVRKLGRPDAVLLVTTAATIVLIAVTPYLGGIFAILLAMQLLRGVAQGFMQPLMFSIQSTAVGKDYQGAVVGLRVTANRLFSAVLPPIMGFVADTFSLKASFVVTGIGLVAGCAALGWLVVRHPEFGIRA